MIKLDLRTDLAKVTPETLGPLGSCKYSGPCAVGVMMSPEEREQLAKDGHDGSAIRYVYAAGRLSIPHEQKSDFGELQYTFDRGNRHPGRFWEFLACLKEKYGCV